MAFGKFPFFKKNQPPKAEAVERAAPTLDAETQEMFNYCKEYAKNFLTLQFEGKPEDAATMERIKSLIDAAEPGTTAEGMHIFSELKNRRRMIMEIARQVNDAPAMSEYEKPLRTLFVTELIKTTETTPL